MFLAARRRARDRPRGPVLPAGAVLRGAARAGRRHAGRIIVMAIGVTSVASATEITVHDLAEHAGAPASILSDLGAAAVSMLGVVFLSGFLSQIVGQEGHGRSPVGITGILRGLPWRRLICADLLVVLLVAAGMLALVIPGLIAANLFAVIGPVIEIEDQPVMTSLRRSVQLVRRHFWKVALIATVPVTLADELSSLAPESGDAKSLLLKFAIRGVAEGLIEAALGLVLAELCYWLMAEDAVSGPGSGSSDRTGPRIHPGSEEAATGRAHPAAQ